ncbi:MAG: radical SAM protein [Deltaproteobacteria bacterium]|nr:radical SAM protein [Deltaproteobacteria bacterium]
MMSSSSSLFSQHSRRWRENRYVYPVISRRSRGLSIGVNLSPAKQCNFRCVYCSVDRTVPGPGGAVDLRVLGTELDELLGQLESGALWADGPLAQTPPELRRLNDVAFSGDGEPTASKEFAGAATVAAEVLGRHPAEAKLVVITNATLLHRPEVAHALDLLAPHRLEVWAKLDAGTEEHYQRIDRSGTPLHTVLANLLQAGRARDLVIQSMFVRLHGEPPPPAEIEAWLARLADLRAGGCRITRVQVYTSARRTAEPFVQPLEEEPIEAIAARVRGLGLEAETFHSAR